MAAAFFENATLLALLEHAKQWLQLDTVPAGHVVVEVVLVLAVIKLIFFSKTYRVTKKEDHLTPQEEEELIREWTPEPLVVKVPAPREGPAIVGTAGPVVQLENGKSLVNLATFNFMGLVGNSKMNAVAEATTRKYGVGSCGPRGFYGTIDVHLELEEKAAKFMGVEEAILYSYGFSTIASVIPAYAKRGDIIFYDQACAFAIQQGLVASRSKLVPFAHNDMADLERLLEIQAAEDAKNPKKAKATRRFIVAEGLYLNTGSICDIKQMVHLKYKYKARIFLEESFSFGVLGKTGRGVTEHAGIPVDDVDAIAVALGTSVASIGGLVFGSHFLIDHQRLSGLGYCFSASLPPLLAAAATTALDIIDESAAARQGSLRANAATLRRLLANVPDLALSGDALSPLIIAHLATPSATFHEEEERLRALVDAALAEGLALTLATVQPGANRELHPRRPAIRLSVSSAHTKEQLTAAAKALNVAAAKVL